MLRGSILVALQLVGCEPVSSITLLKIDSTTYDLPTILKSLLTLTAGAGIGFQYSYNWHTRQVEFLKRNSKKDIFQVIYFRGLSNIP